MNNEQATEALIRITTPISHIFDDEETAKTFDSFRALGEGTTLQDIGKILPRLVTLLLKTHKYDMYEIIGALTFKSVEDVGKMNFVETINIFRESYDEVLQSFFTSSEVATKS